MTDSHSDFALLPAGTYYVGDPTYALNPADWDHFMEIADDLDGDPERFPSGRVMAAAPTGADGFFPGTDGFKYAVDSGFIGVMSTNDMSPKARTSTYGVRLNQVHTFPEPFGVRVDGGVMHIADLRILLGED